MRVMLMAVCLAAQVSGSPAAQTNGAKSPDLAKRLVSAMTARQLDAIAAPDPDEPGRFIAALAFPDVQLLVVSAKNQAAEYLKQQLAKRQFREVYVVLQEGEAPSRLFFQDMGCDGVQSGGENVDVFYEGKERRTLFDGKWEDQSLSEEEYTGRLTDADVKYSRALMVLFEAVKRIPVTTDAD